MSDNLDHLRALAPDYLQPGEELIAVANVNYGGKVNLEQPIAGLAGLHAGQDNVLQGQELASRMGENPDVVFPTAKQMALLLTGGRLLVWSRGGFKDKPKAFIGEIPIEAIDRASVEEGRLADHVQIKLSSGWEVNLDSNRGDGGAELGLELVALIQAQGNITEF
jgi:hypothetical protein